MPTTPKTLGCQTKFSFSYSRGCIGDSYFGSGTQYSRGCDRQPLPKLLIIVESRGSDLLPVLRVIRGAANANAQNAELSNMTP